MQKYYADWVELCMNMCDAWNVYINKKVLHRVMQDS